MAKKTAAKKGTATIKSTKGSSRSTRTPRTSKTVSAKTTSAKTKPVAKAAPRRGQTTRRAAAASAPRVGDLPLDHKPVATPKPASTTRKKVSSGLTKKDLAYFRDLLLQKRHELVGDMSSMEREALRSSGGSNLSTLPIHMADQGTDNYEQEFTLGLVEKDRAVLREINHALAKIQAGTYGICEGTGQPISRPRLEAQPWARHSIEYARELEKRGGR